MAGFLRWISTLQRAGVLTDADAASYVAGRLTNPEVLRKAEALPFRLHAAWAEHVPASIAQTLNGYTGRSRRCGRSRSRGEVTSLL